MEIFLLAIGVGAVVLSFKAGVTAGRQQVLQNLASRIDLGLQQGSDFSRQFGIRGMYFVLDYLAHDAKHGTGFNHQFAGGYFIVHRNR